MFFTLTNLPTASESQHTQGLSTGFGYDSSSCVVFCSKKATQFRILSTATALLTSYKLFGKLIICWFKSCILTTQIRLPIANLSTVLYPLSRVWHWALLWFLIMFFLHSPTAPESQHTQGLNTGLGYDSLSCVVFCSKKLHNSGYFPHWQRGLALGFVMIPHHVFFYAHQPCNNSWITTYTRA